MEARSALSRRSANWLVNNHPRNGLAVLLLLRSVNPMSCGIHSKAVRHRLDPEVFESPEVIRIVLLKQSDDSAGTSGINPAEAWIEFEVFLNVWPNTGSASPRQATRQQQKIVRRLFMRLAQCNREDAPYASVTARFPPAAERQRTLCRATGRRRSSECRR